MKSLTPLLFAFIAAIGNAMFAAAQKKAIGLENPFVFILLSLLVCIPITLMLAPTFGQTNYIDAWKTHKAWLILSGVGICITYFGFNLLYTQFGASYYILYAVLSMITTALIVGLLIFRESFNLYHWLSFGCAIMAVVLFSMGNAIKLKT